MSAFSQNRTLTTAQYPAALQQLAVDITSNHIAPNVNGEIISPDAPGLGIEINPAALTQYAVDVEIKVGGKTAFSATESRPEGVSRRPW